MTRAAVNWLDRINKPLLIPAAAMLLAIPVSAFGAPSGAEAGPSAPTPTEAPVPTNSSANPTAVINAVSCPVAGSCVAGGAYEASTGNQSPLLEILSNAAWAPVTVPGLPNIPPGSDVEETGVIESVSCWSSGGCVAVGYYEDPAGYEYGLIDTLSGGTWTAAAAPEPPDASTEQDGSQSAELGSVSCWSAENCIAVGGYSVGDEGYGYGLVDLLSGSSWTPVTAPQPSGAASQASGNESSFLASVSCASDGYCADAGGYTDGNGNSHGFVDSLMNGTWTATAAPLPGNAAGDQSGGGSSLNSISCASEAACTVVGEYHDTAGYQYGLVDTLSGSTWAPSAAVVPANAGTDADGKALTNVVSVSCPSAGDCAAVGQYRAADGSYYALGDELSGGSWSAGTLPLPANIGTGSNHYAYLASVACSSAGVCAAVGWYYDTVSDDYPLIETLDNGTWSGIEAPQPANAGTDADGHDDAYLQAVSCATGSGCDAGAGYEDSGGGYQGLLEDFGIPVSSNSPTSTADQPLAEQVNGGQLVLSCSGPAAGTYPLATCPLVNLSPNITLNGTVQTATGTASTIYVSDSRGNPAVGWSLSTYMVPTPGNPNSSCAGLADFCNSSVASNALSIDGQIPSSDLSIGPPTCATYSGGNTSPMPGSGGRYGGASLGLCTATAGQSGGTFTMNTSFTLTVPSSVYAGLYEGTVEYLVS